MMMMILPYFLLLSFFSLRTLRILIKLTNYYNINKLRINIYNRPIYNRIGLKIRTENKMLSLFPQFPIISNCKHIFSNHKMFELINFCFSSNRNVD